MFRKIFYNISMAGPTKAIFDGGVPYISGRLMGFMTGQAVLQFKILSVFFMTIQARIGFSLTKAMGMMTFTAILFRMGTW